jgi:hypothetical protein
MPRIYELIDRAHAFIEANQIKNAMFILDDVLRLDPKNIEAWEAYMRISRTREDLERLRVRALRTEALNTPDELGFLAYQRYILRRLDEKIATLGRW